METIKPDQERVKNLLLDTVTLLCKNSLQYENHLRVEGLLGVAVDDNDTFFLHISEHFKSDAYLERIAAEKERESQEKREREEQEARTRAEEKGPPDDGSPQSNFGVSIKKEAEEGSTSDDLMITGTSNLQTPNTVAQPATMIAGQRRAQRRPHSPTNRNLGGAHSDIDQDTSFQGDSSSYLQTDSGDGSFAHYDNQSMKQEQWDDEPPLKRQSVSNPWPNLSTIEGMASQAAETSFQDTSTDQFAGGGDLSQPGCSAWPTNVSGSQDSVGVFYCT